MNKKKIIQKLKQHINPPKPTSINKKKTKKYF